MKRSILLNGLRGQTKFERFSFSAPRYMEIGTQLSSYNGLGTPDLALCNRTLSVKAIDLTVSNISPPNLRATLMDTKTVQLGIL